MQPSRPEQAPADPNIALRDYWQHCRDHYPLPVPSCYPSPELCDKRKIHWVIPYCLCEAAPLSPCRLAILL